MYMQLNDKVMIQSPLNYTGGKFKLLPQILPYFPENIDTFVDLFCGGCNVGINVPANKHIYNDCSEPLINLYSVMQRVDTDTFIERLDHIINKYQLSDVSKNGYEFYGCHSSDGLSSYNREKYTKLREDVNSNKTYDEDYYTKLYALILYSFNNQIRFNHGGDFNLPPGKRDFNLKMRAKLHGFLVAIHEQEALFSNRNFMDVKFDELTERDFVYADPPYLITCASYNEQGGWTEAEERDLLDLLDELSKRNVKFALSNVLEAKGKTNNILLDWINNRPEYKMLDLNYTYRNANYQRRKREAKTREILVINY